MIREITFSRRINLGNYEHAELKFVADADASLPLLEVVADLQRQVDYALYLYRNNAHWPQQNANP